MSRILFHQLKINAEYASQHSLGVKPWELRKNDRDFKEGDYIEFQVIDQKGETIASYIRQIVYIFKGGQYGLEEGYVIMTLEEN